jgi:hypothetical protein
MSTHENLIADLNAQKSLEKALRYLESNGFPLQQMEVIAQDEFSHDVVVPFPGLQNFLALGVT